MLKSPCLLIGNPTCNFTHFVIRKYIRGSITKVASQLTAIPDICRNTSL